MSESRVLNKYYQWTLNELGLYINIGNNIKQVMYY